MKTVLVVTQSFGAHLKGGRIAEPKAVAHALEHHRAHVVPTHEAEPAHPETAAPKAKPRKVAD